MITSKILPYWFTEFTKNNNTLLHKLSGHYNKYYQTSHRQKSFFFPHCIKILKTYPSFYIDNIYSRCEEVWKILDSSKAV